MRRTAVLLLACAACAAQTTTVSRSVRGVPGVSPWPGSLAAFVAAVPPFEEGGECRTYQAGRDRVVTLQFKGPDGAERSVALTLDARGTLTGYSDVRGDLGEHGRRPRTSVSVGLDEGTSTAMNEHGGARGTPGLTTGTADEAMDLESLGNPRRMIEQVRRRCMGVAADSIGNG